jgi:hypothetical protein
MSTEAETFFRSASSLPPGRAIFKDFESLNSANSFRIGLYKVRSKVEDFTVEISIANKRVIATKAKQSASYGMLENGVETGESLVLDLTLLKKEDEYKKAVDTVIAGGFDQETIDYILNAEYLRIFGKEKEKEETPYVN